MHEREPHMVGIALPTLRELCEAQVSAGGMSPESADVLRAAGYSGGQVLLEVFEQWLRECGYEPSADLPLGQFTERLSEFLRASGWGDAQFAGEGETATLTVAGCWESTRSGGGPGPACHVTTGTLAAFFGALAGYEVAVLETDCASAGADACRFVIGNPEVVEELWESLNSEPTTSGSSRL